MSSQANNKAQTPLDDVALKRAFAAGASETSFAEGSALAVGCWEPDRMWAAVHGELAASEVHEIVDHTASCPACAEEWRLARELGRLATIEGAASQAADPSRQPPARILDARQRFRRIVGPLAGLAAAAVLLLMVNAPGNKPSPEFRDGGDAEILSLVTEGDTLARGEFLLRWSGVEGAAYSVLVTTEDLTVVAQQGGLVEPRYLLPKESLQNQPAGTRLLWQVEAVLPNGVRHSSQPFVVRLE